MTDAAIRAVAVLDDESRRAMYSFIRAMHRPVTREEAASSTGISRRLAGFHLDKLVDAGLLVVRNQPAPPVRKVGRRPKVYEPTVDEVSVTIPGRQHRLLAEILLDAVLDERNDETARQAALRAAGRHGAVVGDSVHTQLRPGRLGLERALTTAASVLDGLGFEPTRESADCVRLRNCPFHPLAAKAPDLVCEVNRAFLAGLLDGLHATTVRADLRPREGDCCVELRAVPRERNET